MTCQLVLDRNFVEMGEWDQNGFPNTTDSSISFNEGTRVFTIQPSVTSFDYYIAGDKYTISSADTVTLTDTEGLWTIYYDGTTLTALRNATDAQIETIMLSKCFVAYIYWDATNNKGELFDERHGMSMSPDTHRELHFTAGTTYFDGLALGDFSVDGNGSDDAHAQFSVATGQIFDEDMKHVINAIGSTTGLEIWYRSNSNWRKDTQAGFSVLNAPAGRVYYDNSGTLTEVTDGKWVLYHIFAWNAADLNPIAIMGQAEYSTVKAARLGALTEINSILLGTLPSKEMKIIGTVIFQTKDTYTNSVKARIVSTDEGDDYVDWRTALLSPSAPAGDHGALAGLGDDDHTQYALLAGRSGGQTLIGSTLTTETLVLQDNAIDGNQLTIGSTIDLGGLNLANQGTGHDGFSDHVANEHIDWTGASDNLITTGDITANTFYINATSDHIITNASDDLEITNANQDKDIVFKGDPTGGGPVDLFRIDVSTLEFQLAATWKIEDQGSNKSYLKLDDGTGTMIFYSSDAYFGQSVINMAGARVEVDAIVYDPGTQSVTAAGGISSSDTLRRIAGSGGAIDITKDPQISAGGQDGQLLICEGTNDTNTVKVDDGTGLQLAGGASFTLGLGDVIAFIWNSGRSLWIEQYRSDN